MSAAKKSIKKSSTTKLGECCELLALVLQRDAATVGTPRGAPRGFEVAPWIGMGPNQGKTGQKLIYRFPKAKRTDDRTHGHGTKFAEAAIAHVEFCPFCGAPLKDAK